MLRETRNTGSDEAVSRAGYGGRRLLLCLGMLIFAREVSADVPLNGRRQDLAFDTNQVHAVAAEAYRVRLQALAAQRKLDNDAAQVARIRNIAARVVAQAVSLKPEARNWPWDIHVTETRRIEASSMAGGKILLGLPPARAEKLADPEIAALIAHEVAHAIAEHVHEQLSQVHRSNPAYAHFGVEDTIAVMDWDLSLALRLQPLSRLHELEADDLGIHLTAQAGFRPHGLTAFYKELDSGTSTAGLLDSHGSPSWRVSAIKAFVAYAKLVYAESVSAQPRQYSFTDSLVR